MQIHGSWDASSSYPFRRAQRRGLSLWKVARGIHRLCLMCKDRHWKWTCPRIWTGWMIWVLETTQPSLHQPQPPTKGHTPIDDASGVESQASRFVSAFYFYFFRDRQHGFGFPFGFSSNNQLQTTNQLQPTNLSFPFKQQKTGVFFWGPPTFKQQNHSKVPTPKPS